MTVYQKKKNRGLYFFVFILFFLLLIGPVSCGKGKKGEESAASPEPSHQGVSSVDVSSRDIQEPEEKTVGQSPDIAEPMVEVAMKRLQNCFFALEDAIQRIPRETFDLEAIIQKAGGDPIKVFEWVRDETYLVPYRGSLRGPIGVLMDRYGNSLDRALLLAELIKRAGFEARLARRHLSEDEVSTILKRTESRPVSKASSFSPTPLRNQDDLVTLYVQNYKLDRKILLETITKAQRIQEQKIQQIKSEQKELATDILALLNEQAKKGLRQKERVAAENLKDHWWVQWEKDGQWINLDPALTGKAPGKTLGEPEETADPGDLDEDLFHAIKVRVVAEQLDTGNLKEKSILEYKLIPSRKLAQRIILRHLPLNWPPDKEFLTTREPLPFLKEAMSKQTEWQAVLEIDGEAVEKSYITASGNISDKPSQKASAKKRPAGGLGRLFGGLAGVEEEKEEEKEKAAKPTEKTHLTAEWLEFEIYTPGRPLKVERREIFDLIGPGARKEKDLGGWKLTEECRLERALKITGRTEILPLVCALSSEFIEELTASYTLLHKDIYLNLIENYGSWEPQELFQEMTKIKPLPAKLYALALNRFRLSPFGREVYLSSPNILACHSVLIENENGELVEAETLDIIANDISLTQALIESGFAARIEQGILDTVAEAAEMDASRVIENAASLFRQSKAQGIGWSLIQGMNDPSWKKLRFPVDFRARLEKELSQGFHVIVPEKEIRMAGKPKLAWWRLEPETGNLLGLGEKGAGQAMTEYAEQVEIVLQLKEALEIYGSFVRCLGLALTAPLRGSRPQHDELVIECIWKLVCEKAASAAEAFLDIETNWTNIIIKKTLDWAMGSLCEALWEKGIEGAEDS